MLNLYYDKSIGKTEKYEERKCFMVNDYTLVKVLDKIKKIAIEKLDDIRILIDTGDKFLDNITLKNVVVLMTCVIKESDNFYRKLFLEEVLHDE